jgi:hypothetical protein
VVPQLLRFLKRETLQQRRAANGDTPLGQKQLPDMARPRIRAGPNGDIERLY